MFPCSTPSRSPNFLGENEKVKNRIESDTKMCYIVSVRIWAGRPRSFLRLHTTAWEAMAWHH